MKPQMENESERKSDWKLQYTIPFASKLSRLTQRGDEAPTIKGNHPREKGGTIFFLQLRGKFLLISVKWGKGIGRRKTSCNFLCLKKNFDCIWTLNS